MFFEGANLEYKREWTGDESIHEIISFLNTSGGILQIGISDDGEVYGVEDPDTLMVKITNKVCDCIRPSAKMLVMPEILEDKESGKHIISCRVVKGADTPYYDKKLGLMKGVFVRIGSSKVQADEETVRALLRESDPVSFESKPSPNQKLSFAYATMYFERNGIEFSSVQQQTLGLVNENGIYSNLGLWLSDQCPHFIKAAAFEGEDVSVFKQRTDITGSLLMQFDSALQFVANNNCEHMYIDRTTMQRLEFYKFPPIAVREALLNALMHRDYSLPHATQLKIFSNRLELVSFGGLLPELPIEKVGCGLSACRNEKLAWVFYRLNLVEAYGTGIPKIFKEYSDYAPKPQIDSSAGIGTFSIILPGVIPPRDAAPTNLFI